TVMPAPPPKLRTAVLADRLPPAYREFNCRGMIFRVSPAQCFLRVARDPLIAFGQAGKFLTADNVLDGVERLVPGALKYFAQNRIRRIGAVGEHDARGRLEALLVIDRKRWDRAGIGAQRG